MGGGVHQDLVMRRTLLVAMMAILVVMMAMLVVMMAICHYKKWFACTLSGSENMKKYSRGEF